MQYRIMFLNLVLSISILSFSSCSIKGEEICGIWNTNTGSGNMQVEITPWKGHFLGYLLEYHDGKEKIRGSKEEDFIFITDLEFQNNKYQNGKIYLNPNSEVYCGLTLELLNENQVKAIYTCEGHISEEIWYRKGAEDAGKMTQIPATGKSESRREGAKDAKEKSVLVRNEVGEPRNSPRVKQKATAGSKIERETKKQSTFFVIGIQQVVPYDDFKAIEKASEALWAKAYQEDFSEKLKNIIAPNRMYVSYSSYDQPKGKMTITLGYKVKDLSTIPSGLQGVSILSNEYLVYPLSGDKSDFTGEGWEQLDELMKYRKANSADFEVYTFDDDYNIKKGELWMATK